VLRTGCEIIYRLPCKMSTVFGEVEDDERQVDYRGPVGLHTVLLVWLAVSDRHGKI